MHRLSFVLLLVGCVGDPVGDPCVPERIQRGGFVATETYVETGSPQCVTRLCVVRGLSGDPSADCSGEGCPTDEEIRQHVYCTVRCDGDEDCPVGFACDPVGDQGLCLRAP